MRYHVKPSTLRGAITIPPSKSHTLRAILFASLAHGQSIIRNYLPSPDTLAMIAACRALGAKIAIDETTLAIIGYSGKPSTPGNVIDAGNSGQVLRFIASVSALTNGYTVLTGDASIRTNRPMQPLLDALTQLGVTALSTKADGHPPIIIKGPFTGGSTHLSGEDSQPVSGLLIASAFAKNKTYINVANPGETPWIDLTLSWFKRLKIPYTQENYSTYVMMGNAAYEGFDYTVPGDFSSCAYPLIAALITHSEIELHNVDMQDVQGDKAIIPLLKQMGASIIIDDALKKLQIKTSKALRAQTIDVNHIIDALPILAVLACFAEGETHLHNAAIARKKESDRLAAITKELKQLGANIAEYEDGLVIKPAKLLGARLSSHGDHRIAMALSIAALCARGETFIDHIQCVNKSYPAFANALKSLGASIEEVS